jgi:hypothetical protein
MLKKTLFRTAFLLVLTNLACLSLAYKPVVLIPENANIAAAVASARGVDVEFDIQGILVPRNGKKSLKVRPTSAFSKDSTYRIDQDESLPLGSTRQVLVSSDDEESLAVISVDVNGGEAAGFMTVGHGQDSLFGIKQGRKSGVKASDPEAFTPPKWSGGLDDDGGTIEAHHHDHHGDEEQDHVHFKPGLRGIESLTKSLKANLDSRRLTTPFKYEVKLFLEIDSVFYNNKGRDIGNVMNYVNILVSAANKIFEKEILTHLTIQHVQVYTSESSDPYSSATSPRNALSIMENNYGGASNFGGGDGEIDIHHAFLGKGLGGGIAYVGVLCDKSHGFGLVASMSGDFDNVQETMKDFLAFAHELGHNFGSDHTQNYSPPVDECWSGQTDEQLTCPDSTIQNQGAATLMSYCHLCDVSDNLAYTFGGYYDNSTAAWEPDGHIDSLGFSVGAERVPQQMYEHVQSRGTCVQISPTEVGPIPANPVNGTERIIMEHDFQTSTSDGTPHILTHVTF